MRFVLALAAILLASSSAAAQIACTSKDISAALLRDHGEHLIFQGAASGGLILEVYASQDRGTWTVVRRSNGLNCLIAFGKHWEPGASVPESEPEEET